MNECQGMMEPIGIDRKGGKVRVVFRCVRCKEVGFNVVALDDNNELITRLNSLPW